MKYGHHREPSAHEGVEQTAVRDAPVALCLGEIRRAGTNKLAQQETAQRPSHRHRGKTRLVQDRSQLVEFFLRVRSLPSHLIWQREDTNHSSKQGGEKERKREERTGFSPGCAEVVERTEECTAKRHLMQWTDVRERTQEPKTQLGMMRSREWRVCSRNLPDTLD
jgi:hypothetical protein